MLFELTRQQDIWENFLLKERRLRPYKMPKILVSGVIDVMLYIFMLMCGRHSGLMVGELDSGSNGLSSSPGWGIALCSWARYFTLIVCLFTQVYKWVLVNLMLRG